MTLATFRSKKLSKQSRMNNERDISSIRKRLNANGDWRSYSRTSVSVTGDPTTPLGDANDHRIAWWFGKRIYLGNDSQIGKLFWLLATRPGYARPRAEILHELFNSADDVEEPVDPPKGEVRLRKVLSRLRDRLRESGIDDHVLIVNEKIEAGPPWCDTKGLTMIIRCGQPSSSGAA